MADKLIRVQVSNFAYMGYVGAERDLDSRLVLGLLQRNKFEKKGKRNYSPIGGAVELTESGLAVVRGFNPEFEEPPVDRGQGEIYELRLKIPGAAMDEFKDWLYSAEGREITLTREMEEELAQDLTYEMEVYRKVFDTVPTPAYGPGCMLEMVKPSTRVGQEEVITHYFFFSFPFAFKTKSDNDTLLQEAQTPSSIVRLLTPQEIYAGKTKDGKATVAQDLFKSYLGDNDDPNIKIIIQGISSRTGVIDNLVQVRDDERRYLIDVNRQVPE